MNSATRVLLDLVSSTQSLFFFSALTRNDLDGDLATDVLVVVLTGKILSPVPTSHWVYGALDEDGGHIQLVDDDEGHGPLVFRRFRQKRWKPIKTNTKLICRKDHEVLNSGCWNI